MLRLSKALEKIPRLEQEASRCSNENNEENEM